MNDNYIEYYLFLENLRKSGVTNMYGAGRYLEQAFDIDHKFAQTILCNWMENYSEIAEKFYR